MEWACLLPDLGTYFSCPTKPQDTSAQASHLSIMDSVPTLLSNFHSELGLLRRSTTQRKASRQLACYSAPWSFLPVVGMLGWWWSPAGITPNPSLLAGSSFLVIPARRWLLVTLSRPPRFLAHPQPQCRSSLTPKGHRYPREGCAGAGAPVV